MFALSTYADSERWVSSLEPLLYPTGVTLYRPFSYRPEYFEPTQTADQLPSLLDEPVWREGFFGIRFRDPAAPDFLKLFVPLRKVTLVDVQHTDSVNLRFRLGPYILPEFKNGATKRTLPSLDLTHILTKLGVTKLFMVFGDPERTTASNWQLSPGFPSMFWDAFRAALSPPAWERVKWVTLLRLESIRRRGETRDLQPQEIDSARHMWGYRLRQATTYDLTLSYNRLVDPGIEAPPQQHRYFLSSPSEELQASRRYVDLIGNYRTEEMWVCPLMAGRGPVQVAFEPSKLGEVQAVVDQSTSKTVGLRLDVLVEPRKWPTSRKFNVILALALASGAAFLLHKYPSLPAEWQKAALVLLSILIAVFIDAVKDIFVHKD